jgi:hypothetical protein
VWSQAVAFARIPAVEAAVLAAATGQNYRTARLQRFPRQSVALASTNRAYFPSRLAPVMVEGHQCHRVGYAHRLLLLGKKFIASSPNGRFVEGTRRCEIITSDA